jgi:hypothetical protein
VRPQTITAIHLPSELTLGALDPVVFSEIVYDIDALAPVE